MTYDILNEMIHDKWSLIIMKSNVKEEGSRPFDVMR
jgi:hypothetical protein